MDAIPTPTDNRRAFLLALFGLFVFYYLPVLVIWRGWVPIVVSYPTLLAVNGILALMMWRRGHTWADLGIRTDNLRVSALQHGAGVVFWGGLILTLYALDLIREPQIPDWPPFFPFYVLVLSPSQEFIYRSVLFAEMRRLRVGQFSTVIISTVTYSLLHVIYQDALTVLVTFVMGIFWGMLYWRTPNFWTVTASHAILGTLAIVTGLI